MFTTVFTKVSHMSLLLCKGIIPHIPALFPWELLHHFNPSKPISPRVILVSGVFKKITCKIQSSNILIIEDPLAMGLMLGPQQPVFLYPRSYSSLGDTDQDSYECKTGKIRSYIFNFRTSFLPGESNWRVKLIIHIKVIFKVRWHGNIISRSHYLDAVVLTSNGRFKLFSMKRNQIALHSNSNFSGSSSAVGARGVLNHGPLCINVTIISF